MTITVTCGTCLTTIEAPDADDDGLEAQLNAGTGPYALPCHCASGQAAKAKA